MAKIIGAAVVLALIAAGLAGADSALPTPRALHGLDAAQAIEVANEWGRDASDRVTSYLTTEAVTFEFTDGTTASIELPENRVMLAIAPFANHTHTCAVHYFSSCQGELVNLPVDVRAVATNGTPLFSGQLRTLANGFLELWLPKNQSVELTLSAFGFESREVVSTAPGAPTCITTMQLR